MEFCLVEVGRFEHRLHVVGKSVAFERIADKVRIEFLVAVLIVKDRDRVVGGWHPGKDAFRVATVNRRPHIAEYFGSVARKSVGAFEQRASELALVVSKTGDLDFYSARLRNHVGSGGGR